MSEPKPLLKPVKPLQVPTRLWRDGAFTTDLWRPTANEEAIPSAGYALISLARWRAERADMLALGTPIGICVGSGENIEPVTDQIEQLSVIALEFAKFSDGRSYSAARRLREAGYSGEIRATGDVLVDQIPLMLRAGFDAFEVAHAATVSALEQGRIPAVSRVYQTGAEVGPAGDRFRHRRGTRSMSAAERTE
ncbi:MAG: DUF934 domain-containing protein [Hyphomicrobium aestuarii]|nr:DUF934 domain-containing protein [Hyphomicrobium aestuarii]